MITEYNSLTYCSETILDKRIRDDFNFPIDNEDILFTLTFNPSIYRENVSNLISKMVVIREPHYINLDILSKTLAAMHIKELNIFSIDNQLEKMKIVKRNSGCSITYTEMDIKHFTALLNYKKEQADFLDYNKYSLYILRSGGFLDIKNLFNNINGYEVNVGRGGSQKAHILSPLDFRLSSYIMAIFNFDCNKIACLNAFNDLAKYKYLSYKDKTIKIYRN